MSDAGLAASPARSALGEVDGLFRPPCPSYLGYHGGDHYQFERHIVRGWGAVGAILAVPLTSVGDHCTLKGHTRMVTATSGLHSQIHIL